MIQNKLRAGYPGLYLVTHEEQRAEAMIAGAVTGMKEEWQLFAWTVTQGRYSADGTLQFPDEDAHGVLGAVKSLQPRTVLVLKDYHLFLAEPNPLTYRMLKDALFHAKTANICLVILAPVLKLPAELEKLFAVVEFSLPDKAQLEAVLQRICETNAMDAPKGIVFDNAIAAASGLTTNEAEDAFALSIIESGQVDPSVIAREKAETIRKNGILEIIHSPETIESIGGLEVMKQWLVKRRNAFGHEAAAYQLPVPKGMLVFGIPGTGKSLTAKACASAFGGIPLLKLDAGRIFGGIVGESEANLRTVFRTAEAVAPCVLWIDEIEKGFSKSHGGSLDGGTSERVFGSLLQWMTDKTAPVFIVATANDVTKLDSALVRKGRFDELFYVDLPDAPEREAIWRIQIRKYGRDPKSFDLAKLAAVTENCTGSEIEAVLQEALYHAFDEGREPELKDVTLVLKDFVPLSKMMADDIKRQQDWAKGRARRASGFAPSVVKTGRKLAA